MADEAAMLDRGAAVVNVIERERPGRDDDRALGLRLKALRRERNLSIQELAALSGLSTGMLSQIERGLSTPSLRSLRLLGVALGVPISWFFTAPDDGGPEAHYIVRRGRRRLLKLSPTGVMKELLSPDGTGLLELYELTLQPGGSSGADFYSHHGEKAGVVLAATLRLWLDERPYELHEGDSFRFPSLLPHRFDNPGRTPARVVWVITPPMPRPAGGAATGSLTASPARANHADERSPARSADRASRARAERDALAHQR